MSEGPLITQGVFAFTSQWNGCGESQQPPLNTVECEN